MWVHFFLQSGLEVALAFLIASGGRWAKPFLSEQEWHKQMEMMVDFLVVCQGWATCPVIFLSTCTAEESFSSDTKAATFLIVILIMAIGLLMLANWKRAEFFAKPRIVQWTFRLVPIFFLIGKLFLEYLKTSHSALIKP